MPGLEFLGEKQMEANKPNPGENSEKTITCFK